MKQLRLFEEVQPLKKRKWELPEPWHSRLREGVGEKDDHPILVLAADWHDYRHFCFERGIPKARFVQYSSNFDGYQPGEVRVLATANSWRHPMWANSVTERFLEENK